MLDHKEKYWSDRYRNERTGWDIGYASTPLKEYFDQLSNKELSILIPGAGNAYEAEYLHQNGFKNVTILDISAFPLKDFATRVPTFPSNKLIQQDFFDHQEIYDLIIEQTFFCSFPPKPETRLAYAKKMCTLLSDQGKLVGLWFNFPLTGDMEKRPFGGSRKEYTAYFEPYFHLNVFEEAYNSIPPRKGSEYFGILQKKPTISQ